MLTPPQTMQDVLEILARIEKQQQEILSRLTPKASRKYLTVEEAAGRLDRSAWTVRAVVQPGADTRRQGRRQDLADSR